MMNPIKLARPDTFENQEPYTRYNNRRLVSKLAGEKHTFYSETRIKAQYVRICTADPDIWYLTLFTARSD